MKKSGRFPRMVADTTQLSNLMFGAANQQRAFTTVLAINSQREILAGEAGWANGLVKPDSRAFLYGPEKAYELMHGDDLSTPFARTPLDGYFLSQKVRGGARQQFRENPHIFFIVSVSGYKQDGCDLMLAIPFLWGMQERLSLNLVGFGHHDEAYLMRAVRAEEEFYGRKATIADYHRALIPVRDVATERWYWREHSTGPGVVPGSICWHVATQNPRGLMQLMEQALEVQADYGETEQAGKLGRIWQRNVGGDDRHYGIVAQERWVTYTETD